MAKIKTIKIIGRADEDELMRGQFDNLKKFGVAAAEVRVSELKRELTHFLAEMDGVVKGLPGKLGQFSLDSISLTVEVSAKGQVIFLGTGGELAGKGGITFTLKREK